MSEPMLAGRRVTPQMVADARRAKQAGQRVYLITAGELPETVIGPAGDLCVNCNGFGSLYLEVVAGGPFKNVPAGRGDTGDGEGPSLSLRPAWHAGSWWLVARTHYPCPVCKDVKEILL
jgi:hypothetical protein